MKSATVRTPAKLNLGLEIIARRPDGYHDLVTIFQAIDLYDEFTVEPATTLNYHGDPRIPAEQDIARRAFLELGAERGWLGDVYVRKQIPIAAGLGGGSSDAALVLRLAALAQPDFDAAVRARAIGADVPFLLHGGTALATGIGDHLKPLPTPPWWFVVVVPPVEITRKTAALFAGLRPADCSAGARVRTIAKLLEREQPSVPAELPNAFERQMLEYAAVAEAHALLGKVAGRIALSGAGPALFSWHATETEAWEVAGEVRERTRQHVRVARALGPHSDESALHAFMRVLEAGTSRGTFR